MLISDIPIKRPTLTIAAMLAIAALGVPVLPELAAGDGLREVRPALLEGMGLAMAAVLFFLRSIRSAVIAAVAASIAVLAAVGAVHAVGLVPSTTGLALALGILIDDAIVVRERFVAHIELGSDPRDAASTAAREVGPAMVAATLASTVPFVPIVRGAGFGYPGLVPLAATAVAAMVVSWLVSSSVVPALSASWPGRHSADRRESWVDRQLGRLDGWLDRLEDRYHELLAWSLDHRLATVGIAIASLALLAQIAAARPGHRASDGVGENRPTHAAIDVAGEPIRLVSRDRDSQRLSGVARRSAGEVRRLPGAVDVRRSVAPATTVDEAAARTGAGHERRAVRAGAGLTVRIAETLGIAVLLVYLVLALQLGSFVGPLAILIPLPLSLAGVAGALMMTGDSFGALTGAGALVVIVIAVRHAIVLVDLARRRRVRGVRWRVALIEAGRFRFRPILTASCALGAAAAPLAAGATEGGEAYRSLGMAVIGGLLVSAPVTLLVVPAVFEALQEAKERGRRWVTARRRGVSRSARARGGAARRTLGRRGSTPA